MKKRIDVTKWTIKQIGELSEQGYELDFPRSGKIVAVKKKTPVRASKTSLIKSSI